MATSNKKAETITTSGGESKAAKARAIFNDMQGSPRKEVVQKFVADAGLTEKGAATYYQNFRRDAGMVTARAQTPVAPTASGRSNASGRS